MLCSSKQVFCFFPILLSPGDTSQSISLYGEFLDVSAPISEVTNYSSIPHFEFGNVGEAFVSAFTQFLRTDFFRFDSWRYLQTLSCLAALYRADNITIKSRIRHLIEVSIVNKSWMVFFERRFTSVKEFDRKRIDYIVRKSRITIQRKLLLQWKLKSDVEHKNLALYSYAV